MKHIIGNLKLRLLLFITLKLIRSSQRRSEKVSELLRSGNFIFQVRTTQGAGGYFDVRDGAINLHYGLHDQPDFSQSWNDGNDALRVLTSADETDLLRAFEDRLYRMQGQFKYALWFNEVMKLARAKVN